MNKEVNNEEKTIYPDQLNITIRTSVPGYQRIEYKPFMTIKNSDENGVKFNPLIKLNKSTINKIPEEYRIKEFFNKGLFQSLLNYNGGLPAKNLIQATRYGYIDNNIRVTLDTIFPVGSVIYIGKQPYAIGDIQWTSGDWKIEVKQKKEEIDPNKVTDPALYTQLVSKEIISGEEQLNQLPQNVITGINYNGPPVAQGIKAVTTNIATNNQAEPTNVSMLNDNIPSKRNIPIPPKEPSSSVNTIALTKPAVLQPPLKLTQPLESTPPLELTPPIELKQPASSVKPLAIMAPESLETKIEEISPQEQRMFDTFKSELIPNIQASNFFIKYFQYPYYRNLVKIIFNNFPTQLKSEIRKFYFMTTNYQPQQKSLALSNTSYDKLCEQVTILKSPTDGDCFFKAVADGINIYNYENQDSKIIYANYGINELFTVSILREIVLRYIIDLGENVVNNMLVITEEQVEPLNAMFNASIEKLKVELNTPQLTQQQYLNELNNIYNLKSNFMIYKPNVVPIDIYKYNNPFRVVEKSEIPKYIKSKDYWANDVAIEAICDKLKICIIPLEKYNYNKSIRLTTKTVDRLKALLTNNDLTKEKCSKKVMFLLYKNNHYELIRFKYLIRATVKTIGEGLRKITTFSKKWYTIFKNDDLAPPMHILMLIYGSIYSTLDENSRKNFSIYRPIMEYIYEASLKVMSSDDKTLFIKTFNDFFPNKISIDKRFNSDSVSSQMLIKDGSTTEMRGGQYPKPSYITKKPEETNLSKIAYSITIDMELHPGTSLTPEQINASKCSAKYNAIKKAFADFTGRPYVIAPVYTKTVKNTTSTGGKTRKYK